MGHREWFVSWSLRTFDLGIVETCVCSLCGCLMSFHAHSICRYSLMISLLFRVLEEHLKQLKDKADHNGWRESEALALSSLVQRRLDYLQNAANCQSAKKACVHVEQGVWLQLPVVPDCILPDYGIRDHSRVPGSNQETWMSSYASEYKHATTRRGQELWMETWRCVAVLNNIFGWIMINLKYTLSRNMKV
jgi:hypothetical protein